MSKRWLVLFPTVVSMALRKKLLGVLIVIEVAVLTATIANAMGIAMDTWSRFSTPTGVDESNIGVIRSIGVTGAANDSSAARNLQVLRDVPFVESAAYGAPPLLNNSTILIGTEPAHRGRSVDAYLFQGSQGLATTLGLDMVEGRTFLPGDLVDAALLHNDTQLPVLLTKALADRLFPAGDGLGKMIYSDTNPMRVIGIVRHLRAQLSGGPMDDFAVINEIRVNEENLGGAFTIRTQGGRLAAVLPKAAQAMRFSNPGHVQAEVFALAHRRAEYFSTEQAVTRMLLIVVGILLMILAGGIAGLTHFSIQQRIRQIGILRALGATSADIIFNFACENFVLAGMGVLFGIGLAAGINAPLTHWYGTPRLHPALPFVCGLVLLALSLLTVVIACKRISKMAPARLIG